MVYFPVMFRLKYCFLEEFKGILMGNGEIIVVAQC